MVNSAAKGNQHELEVKKHLEADGWTVFRQHRKPMWMRDKKTQQFRMITVGADIFGCDIVAKKPGRLTRWIQVGADGALSKKEEQLHGFPWDTRHENVEIWLRLKNEKAYRVWVLRQETAENPAQSFVETARQRVGRSVAPA